MSRAKKLKINGSEPSGAELNNVALRRAELGTEVVRNVQWT